MRLRRCTRLLLCVVCLGCLVYACLLASLVQRRPSRRRKLQSHGASQMVVFDEEAYVRGSEAETGMDPYARHAFNVAASDELRSDRPLPDTRHIRCRQNRYSFVPLPTVSVIVTFYNEARSALLRTVMSILNRTPPKLLEEIILVDDCSLDERDGQELGVLPLVQVLRNERRQGLVRSRVRGLQTATGQYIVFLDSHCEVNTGWLEPLLDRVIQRPKTVVSPVIDIIDLDNFQYKPSSAELKGGFDWSLHFKWIALREEEKASRTDPTQPFKTPVIPGGLFLVSREWLEMLGGFDPGLEIWGAENIEISLKAWMCGSAVETVPCSRIGHVFRKRHPYTFPNGSATTYLFNSRRLVDVWFGEHKRFFYDIKPAAKEIEVADLEAQIELKRRLNCKTFEWYLDEVFPELRTPNTDAVAFGQLHQAELCLDAGKKAAKSQQVLLTSCFQAKNAQEWSYFRDGKLSYAEKCLFAESSRHGYAVVLQNCDRDKIQKWARRRRLLIHSATGLCLDSHSQKQATLSECRRHSYSQQWDFSMELQTWNDDTGLK